MNRPDLGFWYFMMRRGDAPHRRVPAAGDTAGALVACGVILATFYVLMFAARFVAIGAIATVLFWTGIGAVVASGIVGTAPPRFLPSWIGNVLAVIVIVCVVAWPVSVVVWLQSLAP